MHEGADRGTPYYRSSSKSVHSTLTPLQVDYKLFAQKFGFKGPPSAKASWNALKKKLQKMNSGGTVGMWCVVMSHPLSMLTDVAAPSLTITSAEGSEKAEKNGKKRKVSDDESDSDAEPAQVSSKKKGRKAPLEKAKSKKVAAAPAGDDEDDDEELPVGGMKGEDESSD